MALHLPALDDLLGPLLEKMTIELDSQHGGAGFDMRGGDGRFQPYRQHGGRNAQPGAKPGHVTSGNRDTEKYQFEPTAIAFGSLVGRQFLQILGGSCVKGPDQSRIDLRTGQSRFTLSYLAFDFKRELLCVRARLHFDPSLLPPALRPVDAELSFDDITSRGIHIKEELRRYDPTKGPFTGKIYDVTVTVSCRRPPKFFTDFEDTAGLFQGNRGRSDAVYRRRATSADFLISGESERDAGPISAIPHGASGYPTHWNTYRWIFELPGEKVTLLRDCARKLRLLAEEDPQMNILASTENRSRTEKIDSEAYQRMYNPPRELEGVPFTQRVLIEGLIGHGILKPWDTARLLEALKQHAIVPAFQARILESLYTTDRIRDVTKVVAGKAGYLRRIPPIILDHLVMIRTVLVTPTRVLIGPPQQEPSNSVTRRYSDRLDGIVRVQFSDEEDKLHILEYTKKADERRPDVGIMARVRRALRYGLTIGGRRFYPVASSPSQQKEHAIWFIDTKVIDGSELRKWMGSVAETVVAKHAARMGLPFSTSRIVELSIDVGPPLEDVVRNGYTFTDGVGVAGREVLNEAARALGAVRGLNATPSAIQFRLGGAKGVLAWWPELAKDHEIRMRPSMVKFKSDLKDLNVVRLAKYQVAFLNRQFILMMCANGIPESLFMSLFEDAVTNIKGMRGRVEAKAYTREDTRLLSLCSDFPLNQIIRAGFHANPLILDMVEIIECRALQDLKWRARIQLNQGVFLIGIADETGTLREGEVFCQFQENEDTEARVIISEVIVCRAPALHPGDVRRAQAVDNLRLRHLKNVIVFSTQGQRDLPNMLGGGDLDGDDFTLIWDQRFVQALREYEPMNYTAPPPKKVDMVTQQDLNENFVQYILNDVLGQVDNTHLALSDFHDDGPYHKDCLHLSTVHSTAVDFAKTGQAAILDPSLKANKPTPTFMDHDGTKEKTYKSEKVLGKLFELVQPDPHFRPSDIKDLHYPTDEAIKGYPVFKSLLDRLRPIKAQYEHDITHVMRRYRVFEPEIPCGIAVRNNRRKRAKEQNLNEPLRDAYKVHVAAARDAAMRAGAEHRFKTTLSAGQVVARHCYALTFEREYVEEYEAELKQGMWGGAQDEDGHDLRPTPMTSFAWIFWQELVEIAQALSRPKLQGPRGYIVDGA